jgi:hypothetical protein
MQQINNEEGSGGGHSAGAQLFWGERSLSEGTFK